MMAWISGCWFFNLYASTYKMKLDMVGSQKIKCRMGVWFSPLTMAVRADFHNGGSSQCMEMVGINLLKLMMPFELLAFASIRLYFNLRYLFPEIGGESSHLFYQQAENEKGINNFVDGTWQIKHLRLPVYNKGILMVETPSFSLLLNERDPFR